MAEQPNRPRHIAAAFRPQEVEQLKILRGRLEHALGIPVSQSDALRFAVRVASSAPLDRMATTADPGETASGVFTLP